MRKDQLGISCMKWISKTSYSIDRASRVALVGKNLPANAGDVGSIPGSGRSLEGAVATCSSVLAWRVPWTEGPGGLQFMGSQRVGHDRSDLTHT